METGMKEDIKIYVGLDVHKDTIAVALRRLAGKRVGWWARWPMT